MLFPPPVTEVTTVMLITAVARRSVDGVLVISVQESLVRQTAMVVRSHASEVAEPAVATAIEDGLLFKARTPKAPGFPGRSGRHARRGVCVSEAV